MDPVTHMIVHFICSDLLKETNKMIQRIQLEKNVPKFTQFDFISQLQMKMQAMISDPQARTLAGMIQEQVQSIKRLGKDSMMPMQVQKQGQETKNKLSANSESEGKKKIQTPSIVSQKLKSNTPSLSLSTARRNTNRSELSIKRKKKQQSTFISLYEDEDDPEMAKFRKRKEYQSQQKEKMTKQQRERRKNLELKQQSFKKQQSEKDFTFDFNGDPINYMIANNKMKFYEVNMNVKDMDKKLKSGLNFLPSGQVSQIKYQRKKTGLEQNSPSVQFSQIPLPKDKNLNDTSAITSHPSQDINKYKLKEYKKQFGGRFTRLSHNLNNSLSNTIDVTPQRADNELNKIFSQRRYLKDEQKSINQSMVSYRTRIQKVTKRKLALPKMHGKYSTLDRYQQY